MMIVPFYVELASDDQRDTVERYISVAGARFVTGEKMEGITLEEVEERVNGRRTVL